MLREPKIKVLGIDDHQDNLNFLGAVVAAQLPGSEFLMATNGSDGFNLALSRDPDVILLDILMPEPDGFKTCRKLKSHARLRWVPVIFLTALQSEPEIRIKALECGADGFLTKPCDVIELTAQIRSMAKLKAASVALEREKERLSGLVADRTHKLELELAERLRAEAALRANNEELTRFNQAAVGRELRMLELKEEIHGLRQRLGEAPHPEAGPGPDATSQGGPLGGQPPFPGLAESFSVPERIFQTVQDLAIHQRACLIYETPEERLDPLVLFVRTGLDRGDRCLCLTGVINDGPLPGALRSRGVDVEKALHSGALQLAPADSLIQKGLHHPGAMVRFLTQEILSARQAGFRVLRIVCDGAWIPGGDPEGKQLRDYEARLNAFFAERDALALCLHGRQSLQPEQIKVLLEANPFMVCGGVVNDNRFYIPPGESAGAPDASRQVNRMLAQLRDRTVYQRRIHESQVALEDANAFLQNARRAALNLMEDALLAQRKAESALVSARQSEERFRLLVENVSDVIWVLDPERNCFNYVSPTVQRLRGYSAGEVLQLDVKQSLTPASWAHLQKVIPGRLADFLQGKEHIYTDELVQPHRNGTMVWTETSSLFQFAEGGRIVIYGVSRDISERKRMEESLRESQERYQLLVETANEGIWAIDHEMRTIYVNQAMADMLGFEMREIYGQKTGAFLFAEDLAPAQERLHLHGLGLDEVYERRFKRRNGSTLWTLVSAKALKDKNGLFKGSFAMFTDITGRKLAEDEVRASREQLRALAARVQAAREEERTNIAREIHDVLAQELTRLKIDLTWVKRRLGKLGMPEATGLLDSRLGEMLQIADTAIGCVQRIATELRPVVLDSLGLAAAIEWHVRDFEKRTGIHCAVSVPAVELPLAREGATAAYRILQEAMTNILRHAQARAVEVILRHEAGEAVLVVRDDGQGIHAAALADPHSIGLAGMRERALILGGHFELRSQPGAGTTMEARIPLAGPA